MKYDLTSPCSSCPFLKADGAIRLRSGRIEELAAGACWTGGEFACHNTVPHEDIEKKTADVEDEDEREFITLHVINGSKKAQHCAGSLIFGLKNGGYHQVARVVERTGGLDRDKLEAQFDLVFEDVDEWLQTAVDRQTEAKPSRRLRKRRKR